MSEDRENPLQGSISDVRVTKDLAQYEKKLSFREKVKLYWEDLVVLWAVIKYSFTGEGRNPLK